MIKWKLCNSSLYLSGMIRSYNLYCVSLNVAAMTGDLSRSLYYREVEIYFEGELSTARTYFWNIHLLFYPLCSIHPYPSSGALCCTFTLSHNSSFPILRLASIFFCAMYIHSNYILSIMYEH